MTWFIKEPHTGRYLTGVTRFTRQKFQDGSPDWKYHTFVGSFTHSRASAKRFDKEKNARAFLALHPDVKGSVVEETKC